MGEEMIPSIYIYIILYICVYVHIHIYITTNSSYQYILKDNIFIYIQQSRSFLTFRNEIGMINEPSISPGYIDVADDYVHIVP